MRLNRWIGNSAILTIFGICFSWSTLFAQIQEAKVSPTNPVVKMPFSLELKLSLMGESDPYISFDAGGCEVLGKENTGEEISTIMVNGRISTSRSSNIRFELVCNQQGLFRISNLQVEIGDKKYSHQPIQFRVLAKPTEPEEVFVEAQIEKETAFVGEGIDLRYYLYRRVSVHANEVKQFPKLNGFIKRFHMPSSNPERVQYGNAMYIRILIYSARLYPENAGDLQVDPIKVHLQYSSENFMSPFGAFGLGKIKTKLAASQPLTVKVLPLPTPPSDGVFTGLVGEHDFELIFPRTKYLVNETMEAKLIAKGAGALENMESPTLLTHQNVESFNVKSSFEEIDFRIARKAFDYTFIGRGNVEIQERIMKLYLFDPQKKEYIAKEIKVPAVSISGAAPQSKNQVDSSPALPNNQDEDKENIEIPKESPSKAPTRLALVAPDFKAAKVSFNMYIGLKYAAFLFLALPFILTFFNMISNISSGNIMNDITSALTKRATYQDIYSAFDRLSSKVNFINYIGPKEFIEAIAISNEAREEILKYISETEKSEYNLHGPCNFKVSKKAIRELENYVKKAVK